MRHRDANKKPCYLGLSIAKSDGTIFDLPAIDLPASKLNQPLPLSAKVGTGAAQYLTAVWSEKKSPCDVDRHSCRSYGYVLDGCVFPANCEHGVHTWLASADRYAFDWVDVPGGVKLDLPDVKILDAGGGPDGVKKVRAIVEKALEKDSGNCIFGSVSAICVKRKDSNTIKPPWIVEGKAGHQRKGVEVLARSLRGKSKGIHSALRNRTMASRTPWQTSSAPLAACIGRGSGSTLPPATSSWWGSQPAAAPAPTALGRLRGARPRPKCRPTRPASSARATTTARRRAAAATR